MRDIRRTLHVAFLGIGLMTMLTLGAAVAKAATEPPKGGAGDGINVELKSSDKAAAFYAIALTMGTACLSAAYAVGKVGAAALGASAEKPELLNKALPFVGLGEGIAVLGMLISFLIWMKL